MSNPTPNPNQQQPVPQKLPMEQIRYMVEVGLDSACAEALNLLRSTAKGRCKYLRRMGTRRIRQYFADELITYCIAQNVHLEALRRISRALGDPLKGQTGKTAVDLADLAVARIAQAPTINTWVPSAPSMMVDAIEQELDSKYPIQPGSPERQPYFSVINDPRVRDYYSLYLQALRMIVAALGIDSNSATELGPIGIAEEATRHIQRSRNASPLQLIEMTLAYERACEAIACSGLVSHSLGDGDEYDDVWYDTASANELTNDVADEIAYLDSRRLLQHHHQNPRWVMILDEAEPLPATAAAAPAAEQAGT